MTDYKELNRNLTSLVEGVPHQIANYANAAALLYNTLKDINWAGFYFTEGDKLILGPFQGKPACIEIHVGKGVCGTAVAKRTTILVEDVHQFEGHIACDAASQSEIVIPIFKNEEIIGVLDIDSPIKSRFSDEDKDGLEEFVKILESRL